MNKWKKRLLAAGLTYVLAVLLATPPVAAGAVAQALHGPWTAAQSQIKAVVENVVFPVIDMILTILFFVKVSSSYFEYRRHGQFDFTAPAILFACLLFTLTAPLYMWSIL